MATPPRQPDLEWTVDLAPSGDDVSQPLPPAASPRRPVAPARWLGLALVVALLAALGVKAYTWLGWHRLQQQIQAEIAYEDAQSQAGAAAVVAGMQASDDLAWIARRSSEAALGLAAPQPAADLVPLPQPAELLALTSPEPGVFEATVQRSYADAAGHAYAFTLVQRYRNLGPGLWERLPPDEAALTATANWWGNRLVVTAPAADLPGITAILSEVDALLVRACADWECPADLRVPLTFAGRVADLPLPGFAPRASPGAYPLAFDLAAVLSPEPRRLVLGAPALVGRPRAGAARQALARSLTAAALAYVAGELTGSARRPADDFLDALIAREEIRLGLSPAVTPTLRPGDYVRPEDLWSTVPEPDITPDSALARRWQALVFLDYALASQPPSVDGRLLVALRRREHLEDWLRLIPATGPGDLLAAWRQHLLTEYERQAPLPSVSLDGLAYHCANGAWIIRDGQRQPLVPGLGRSVPVLDAAGLSSNGRYLAVAAGNSVESLRLELFDLEAGTRNAIVSSICCRLWVGRRQAISCSMLRCHLRPMMRGQDCGGCALGLGNRAWFSPHPFIHIWAVGCHNGRLTVGVWASRCSLVRAHGSLYC